jgi:uncharacterized cupredoxin-like copper-binding protein
MRFRYAVVLALVALSVIASACGGGSTASNASASRTVNVEMRDIAYSPDRVTAGAGETIRFVFHNTGKVRHDAFLGDEAAQMDHEDQMSDTGGMHHGGGGAITVDPDATGELTHTFKAGDSVLIGCHEPGHYTAGMKLAVDVT